MTEIQQFWFGPFMRKQWFGCPPETDELIRTKFGHMFCGNSESNNFLDNILLYDQISRHVYRGDKETIANNDRIALCILEQNADKIETLAPEQRCFAIMPWRHTFDITLLNKCYILVCKWNTESPHPFYKRFAQATLKAIASVKPITSGHWIYQNPDTYSAILDPRSTPVPSTKPILLYENEPLLTQFIKGNPIMQHWVMENPLVISVSGGVDSMVCLYLARIICSRVVCVSIDYANRPEQRLEIQMVNHVCGLLKIPHYVRVIDEVKRPRELTSNELIDRDFYESFTRDIRFDTYKKAISDMCERSDINDSDPDLIPVILGHNQDDTLENVFSNIKKHKNYENLFGMESVSTERGVHIWRPLLHVPKSDIIDFALRHGIPFTYDSTPAWSERGYLRDHVMPTIRDYLPGIVDMVQNYKNIYKIYNKVCEQGLYLGAEGAVCSNPIYTLDYFQKVFKKVALHYKVPYPKNKSLLHLMEQLQKGNANRLTVSVHFIAQRNDDNEGFRIIKI